MNIARGHAWPRAFVLAVDPLVDPLLTRAPSDAPLHVLSARVPPQEGETGGRTRDRQRHRF
jgi:hypothetical protein